ncbi:MAG TPA: LuxR C-terminal-related transcriptional regulator [Thermomicrobiales bacterium]
MADSLPADRSRQPIQLVPVEGRDWLGAPLPAPLTSFVGREHEVQAVGGLLRRSDVRLVSLTGPGGVGKTRLALRLAGDLASDFPDGVVFVPLAPIGEAALVPSTIAQALAVREAGGRPLREILEAFLRGRRLLLVLDNFEQVVGAAPSVTALLAACPDLKALVTSRIALRVLGEQEFPVPPLALPDSERLPPVAELERTEAVALFLRRAREVRPDFALTAETAPIVAQICRRLDGLPLALELAAARSKVLSPPALAARLTNRLQVLTSGPQDQPARLQTMRAAIAWSYDLLTEDEQALFRRLAVFAGGFTLEAAEAIGAEGGGREAGGEPCFSAFRPPPSAPVLDLLSSLVDKSLVRQQDGREGEPRFWMLETIREYGLEQLAAAGEEEGTRRRHAAWYLAMAEELWPAIRRRQDFVHGVNRLAAEHDNLRAALAWWDGTGDNQSLLRLAGAIFGFWYLHGHLREGLSWLEGALMHADGTPTAVRAQALLGAGMLAHYAADDARAIPWLEESLALYRTTSHRWGLAFTLTILGIVAEDSGDYDRAAALFAEGLVHARAADAPVETGLLLFHLGIVAWGRGDRARADALLDEALAVQQASGDLAYGAAESLAFLGLFACERGELLRSVEMQRESLSLQLELGSEEILAVNLANVAMLALADRRPAVAARLFGAAVGQREAIGNPFKLPERAVYDRAIATARSVLRDDDFAAAWDAGRALSLTEAVAEAFAALDETGSQATTGAAPSRPPSAAPGSFAGLTSRELEVLRLLVEGCSDREIAEALFISPRTAQVHVAHIFTKLNVGTRSAAVAAALRAGFPPDPSAPR